MKRICLKCGIELSPLPIAIENDRILSYSRCTACAREEGYTRPKDFLDTFKVPAFSITEDHTITAANRAAATLFHLEKSEILNRKHGFIAGCPYGEEEVCCGRMATCEDCVIKKVIEKTIQSGIGVAGIEAYEDMLSTRTDNSLKFEITSAKVGDRALLFVEPVRMAT